MKLKNIVNKKTIGKYKVFIARLMSYLSIVNFFMILYLFATKEPLGINYQIWLFLAGIICLCVILFDSFFVIEGDADYNFARSPRLIKLEKRIIKILDILEKNQKKNKSR